MQIPLSIVYKPTNKNNLHDDEHQLSLNELRYNIILDNNSHNKMSEIHNQNKRIIASHN